MFREEDCAMVEGTESVDRESRASLGFARYASLAFRILFLFAAGMVVLAYSHPWSPFTTTDESAKVLERLEALGDSALISSDVPVAAMLLYGQTVLGSGYNTVKRDGNAGGHAEINAISSALRAIGERRFAHLDRDSLLLVTSLEPCAMCRGAIVGYNIRNVEILKMKPPLDLVREDLRVLRYYWRRSAKGPAAVQDSLFRRHPDYRAE
jgi:tRNA(Arg) A34 adenosine deaminase TadA